MQSAEQCRSNRDKQQRFKATATSAVRRVTKQQIAEAKQQASGAHCTRLASMITANARRRISSQAGAAIQVVGVQHSML